MKTFSEKLVGMLAAAIIVSLPVCADDNVSVVETPETGTSVNYTNFRSPLQTAPLLKLPVGSVQPKGWLLKNLELQRDGMCGQLGSISSWLQKDNNAWINGTGDYDGEEVPYWLRGYCSLAYILGDEDMIAEAKTWFEGVFSNLDDDGFLGTYTYNGDNLVIWPQMVMVRALQTYYEYTNDERVITALTNFYDWQSALDDSQFLTGSWEYQRGGDNLRNILWLYNITGDEDLLTLMEKTHNNTSDWTQDDDLPTWHAVNIAQGFCEPAYYYMYSGEEDMLQAAYNNFDKARERYGQVPGGMYGADENARTGYFDPRQGTETCAMVEQMAADEVLMGFTGDPFWADHCEKVALNMYTAALMPDMKALRYLTCPNMAVADEATHSDSFDNGSLRGMLSMSPTANRCCQHNHSMGWPYYAEHLVMATTDNGLATMLYAANETTAYVGEGQEITLVETTNYPFEEAVTLTVSTSESVTFPLYLRIPSWSDQTSITVNGEAVAVSSCEGKYVRIEREWANGDVVVLSMPMSVTTDVWQWNKASVSVNYGPLALSLKLDEEYTEANATETAYNQDDSSWQDSFDSSSWPAYTISTSSTWNYGLKVDSDNMPVDITVTKKDYPDDDMPFTLENVPLEFTAVGIQVPSWGFDSTGATDLLPIKWAERSSEETQITLVPMGAARLRISAFPREVAE